MPRWELGSEDRLKKAAMQLFHEKGVDETSVVEIAKLARVTTRTFFRYFPDKRDVLFAESDGLRTALVASIGQAPDSANPLEVVISALTAFNWESLDRDAQRQRHAVIMANPELLERDLMKRDDVAVAFAEALQHRGADPETARLASRVGIQVFFTAYEQWLESENDTPLATTVEEWLSRLESMLPARAKAVGQP